MTETNTTYFEQFLVLASGMPLSAILISFPYLAWDQQSYVSCECVILKSCDQKPCGGQIHLVRLIAIGEQFEYFLFILCLILNSNSPVNMSRRVRRAMKIQSSFKDFVSSNVQEKRMVEEGMHS